MFGTRNHLDFNKEMHKFSSVWVAVDVSELLAVQIIVNAGLDVLFCVIVDDKGFLPIVMITILVFPVPGEGYFVVEWKCLSFRIVVF